MSDRTAVVIFALGMVTGCSLSYLVYLVVTVRKRQADQ